MKRPRARRLFAFAPLLAFPLATACSGAPDDGAASSASSSVNRGTAVPPNTRDKLGLVYINKGDCSGVLLKPSWVLTAQHCFQASPKTLPPPVPSPTDIHVTLASMGSLWAPTASDRVYEFGEHDVVLVHLATPLSVGGSTTFSNTISDVSLGDLKGRTVSCYGQGNDDESATQLDTIWRTADFVVDAVGTDQFTLKRNRLGQSLAEGDSGGPCFYNGQLVGIQSWDSYATFGVSTVLEVTSSTQMSLSYLKAWITKIVQPTPTIAQLQGGFSVIQSNYGAQAYGNFELVAPLPAQGFAHYWRNNASPALAWALGEHFGLDLSFVNGAVVIQSSYGNLEVVASAGSSLYEYWKPVNGQWSTTFPIPGATHEHGTPGFVQSTYGAPGQPGNFEVAVGNAKYGIDYFFRNNSAVGTPWYSAGTIAPGIGLVDDVVMFESAAHTMEIAARSGRDVWHLSRNTNNVWSAPRLVGTRASGRPGFIQSKLGHGGQYELIVPSMLGGYDEYTLDPAVSDTWSAALPIVPGAAEHLNAAALIQSNYGPGPGNLELFGGRVLSISHTWRENTPFPAFPATKASATDVRFIGPLPILG